MGKKKKAKKKATKKKASAKKKAAKKKESAKPVAPKSQPDPAKKKAKAAKLAVVIYTDAPESLDYYPSEPAKHGNMRRVTVSEEGADEQRLAEITKYQADRYRSAMWSALTEEEYEARFGSSGA